MNRTTKRKIKKKVLALTEEILWFLKDMAEMIPYPFEGKAGYLSRLRYYDRYKVSRAFWELDRKGLVKKIKKNRKIYYAITDLGRARVLKYAYHKQFKKNRSDGLSTIIIFDIPEEKRKARHFLRRFLVQNGFIMLQKSVFIGPWEIHNSAFKELLRELKIEFNVNVLEGRMVFK